MLDALTVLLQRQVKGEVTTFGLLARSIAQPVRNTVARLYEAVERGDARIGYWDSWTGTGKVYAFPSVAYAMNLNGAIDRYVWPILTQELITTDMASRIYVWNTLNPVDLSLYKHRSYMHYEGIIFLYEGLANHKFGSKEGWFIEHGLLHQLPVYGETKVVQPRIIKRGANSKVSAIVCRYCCKTMKEPKDILRGIHATCLREIALLTGKDVDHTLKLAIITNEELDAMIAGIQDLRPVLTAEEAHELHPEGLILINDFLEIAQTNGIDRNRALWAIGGKEGFTKPFGPSFAQLIVGRFHYVSKNAIRDLPLLLGEES